MKVFIIARDDGFMFVEPKEWTTHLDEAQLFWSVAQAFSVAKRNLEDDRSLTIKDYDLVYTGICYPVTQ